MPPLLHAGTSVKNIAHWAQGLRAPAPSFRKFDYGAWCWGAWMQPQVGPNQICIVPIKSSSVNLYF